MSAAAPDVFTLAIVKAEARIDSRLLALHLGNQHKATHANANPGRRAFLILYGNAV
ncbi:hypothetical protein [Polaromonas naphthalenivorans]|uniref:hypothetical protein n=1 Tax=Polaromonas naphthalenivorans TaxID=216465 RepID=UPI0000680445|nr:hypothetical protein [Polaromonas naphthalenivorans]